MNIAVFCGCNYQRLPSLRTAAVAVLVCRFKRVLLLHGGELLGEVVAGEVVFLLG